MVCKEGRLRFGWARRDITPNRSASLGGQFYTRISKSVESPLTVTALALETRGEEGQSIDQMVNVSCDLIHIPRCLLLRVREKLEGKLEGFDPEKLMINATHVHTGPYVHDFSIHRTILKRLPEELHPEPFQTDCDVITWQEYSAFVVERISEAVTEAWNARKPGSVGFAQGYAALGFCRRSVYDDNTALMYGPTDTANYRGPEGPEDHGVELMYFWDENGKLTGAVANAACPAQVLEAKWFISSDYWGKAREQLAEVFGESFYLLPLTGAAGDQSPRDLVRRGRRGPSMYEVEGARELGRRVKEAVVSHVEDAYAVRQDQLVFAHQVCEIGLPLRTVSRTEVAQSTQSFQALVAAHAGRRYTENELAELFIDAGVLERAEEQKVSTVRTTEIHVMRLGDCAIATNPFELFTEYGLQMKARSHAAQTFIVQMSCDTPGYLPTEKAVRGGHYSAVVAGNEEGPEGGKLLVETTLHAIDQMFE